MMIYNLDKNALLSTNKITINYSSISFPHVVFVETVTYNLVNLKNQNSFNIGHNANPTFL